jgi:hypothetical protein
MLRGRISIRTMLSATIRDTSRCTEDINEGSLSCSTPKSEQARIDPAGISLRKSVLFCWGLDSSSAFEDPAVLERVSGTTVYPCWN